MKKIIMSILFSVLIFSCSSAQVASWQFNDGNYVASINTTLDDLRGKNFSSLDLKDQNTLNDRFAYR